MLDKLFAPFVLLPHAELGRGLEARAAPKQTQHPRPWDVRPNTPGTGRWDKRNGVKEIVEKPTILTVIVMMKLGELPSL